MEIVKKTINGNEYEFVNSFRDNRSGFVHETKLFCNGYYKGENKIQYYNRTWENYTYQSVMKGLVYSLIENCEKAFDTAYRAEHNIQRMTKAKRETMVKDFQNNQPKNYIELVNLYSEL